ncbi:hypothetical protein [Magnetospirillum sulfuroxidans]|uniref:Secreted protein n=1 Tax=Magnetospirillum sulfuroxidans TaxID=611300 RepID=A0ABS5I9A5_9PROT|nr:hypothetical protein [Magnetospirillum sulfuroxidans]MBR9971020.1 hypothetical protein [Magnetospirillum sulfuroxidans]
MNARIISQSALALSLVAGLAVAPALASETVLVLHDEGNSGPHLVQVESAKPVTTGSAATATATAAVVVLHDESNSGPHVIIR